MIKTNDKPATKQAKPNQPLPKKEWIRVTVKSALGPAMRSVGLTGRTLNGKSASEALPVLRRGIEKLEAQPYLYPALEAVKEWGPYKDKPIDWLKRVVTMLEDSPSYLLGWSE